MELHCLNSSGKATLLACFSEQQQFTTEAGLFQLRSREQEDRVRKSKDKLDLRCYRQIPPNESEWNCMDLWAFSSLYLKSFLDSVSSASVYWAWRTQTIIISDSSASFHMSDYTCESGRKRVPFAFHHLSPQERGESNFTCSCSPIQTTTDRGEREFGVPYDRTFILLLTFKFYNASILTRN